MNSITESLIVAACIFAGSLIGMNLHRVLPDDHLTDDSQSVIKLGTGMLSVLASLVLGLLIATAKSSHDATDQAVRTYAAELALLNETLRDYGATAAEPRDLLRAYVRRFRQDIWQRPGARPDSGDDETARALLEQVRGAIRGLKPVDKGQASLQDEATAINTNLLRQRWLLIEQQGPNVQGVVVVILVSWITVIFVSFGLNAPRNGTVVAAFLICSLAIGGSIFLILEMDRPLAGVMQISSWPIDHVLAAMDW